MNKINPEIFEQAAERIERTGMTKNGYYQGHDEDVVWPEEVGDHVRETDAKCCVLGALAAEAPHDTVSDHALFMAQTLGLGGLFSLVDWNDAPHRRKRDLVKAFRKTAQLARTEE